MKLCIVLSALIAIAMCAPAPQGNPQDVQIVSYVNENDGSGNYRFSYELTDGQKRDETGTLKDVPGADEPVVVMSGSYEFVDDTGKVHNVQYTADENGFHPIVSR